MLGTRSHRSLSISVLGSLDPFQAGISDSLALQLTPVCCWNRWGVIPPACCCLVPGCACCSPGTAGGAVSHKGWVYSGHCPAPVRPCRGLWWDSVLRKCWPEGLLGLSPLTGAGGSLGSSGNPLVVPQSRVWCWSCSVPSCPYTLPVWAGATRAQGPSSVQGWLLCSSRAGAGGSPTSRLGGWSSLLHSWAGGGVKTCGKHLAGEGPPMGMSPIVWGCPT